MSNPVFWRLCDSVYFAHFNMLLCLFCQIKLPHTRSHHFKDKHGTRRGKFPLQNQKYQAQTTECTFKEPDHWQGRDTEVSQHSSRVQIGAEMKMRAD